MPILLLDAASGQSNSTGGQQITTTRPTDSSLVRADQTLPTKRKLGNCVTFDSTLEVTSNVQGDDAEALDSRSSPALIGDEIANSKTRSPNVTAPATTNIALKPGTLSEVLH